MLCAVLGATPHLVVKIQMNKQSLVVRSVPKFEGHLRVVRWHDASHRPAVFIGGILESAHTHQAVAVDAQQFWQLVVYRLP